MHNQLRDWRRCQQRKMTTVTEAGRTGKGRRKDERMKIGGGRSSGGLGYRGSLQPPLVTAIESNLLSASDAMQFPSVSTRRRGPIVSLACNVTSCFYEDQVHKV